MHSSILALDVSGTPRRWLSLEEAITYHAKDQVAWSYGDTKFVCRGGYQHDGTQSIIETNSIIAIKGKGFNVKDRKDVPLTNRTLFGRDRWMCAYCLRKMPFQQLSRDHILPTSKGGLDVWMNVVTCCKSCNSAKGNQLLERTEFVLHYVPYVPNYAEAMILANRNILVDQMDFLKSSLPKHSRLLT